MSTGKPKLQSKQSTVKTMYNQSYRKSKLCTIEYVITMHCTVNAIYIKSMYNQKALFKQNFLVKICKVNVQSQVH